MNQGNPFDPYSWLPTDRPLPERLQQALDKDRLGIYLFEEHIALAGPFTQSPFAHQPGFGLPKITLDFLSQVVPNMDIRAGLHTNSVPLTSITILLYERSIMPFMEEDSSLGYFLDLRQNQPNAPVILVAGNSYFNSGWNPYQKLRMLQDRGDINSAEFVIDNATGADAAAWGNQILDRRVAEIRYGEDYDSKSKTDRWNEALIVTGISPIGAIAVPIFRKDMQHDCLKVLDGVLNYLLHEKRDMKLPLVAYDLSLQSKEKYYTLANNCEEAIALAKDAWKAYGIYNISLPYYVYTECSRNIKNTIESIIEDSIQKADTLATWKDYAGDSIQKNDAYAAWVGYINARTGYRPERGRG